MKYLSKILVVLFAAVTLVACDKDNEAATYVPTVAGACFSTASFSGDADAATLEGSALVTVVRANKKGEATVNLSIKQNAASKGTITNEGAVAVTFADGQATAQVEVKAAGVKPGTSAIADVAITDSAVIDPTIEHITVAQAVITCDYNWVDAGTANVTFEGFYDEATGEVKVQHAEGYNLYRLYQPWNTLYGSGTCAAGYHLEFTVDDDLNITGLTSKVIKNGFPDGYDFYYDPATYPDECHVANEGNVYSVYSLICQSSNISDIYQVNEENLAIRFEWNR